MRQLVLAAVQSAGEPLPGHLDVVGALVCQAARQGAMLVLLPELFSTPFHFTSRVWQWATPQGGKIEQFLCTTARAEGIYLGGSYLEVRDNDFFNTFALASPDGKIVGRVGKSHPCSLERGVFSPSYGRRVLPTELGRIGIGICYDNALRAPVDQLLGEDPDVWLMPMSAPLLPYSLIGRKGVARFLAELRDSPAALARHCGIPVVMANKFGTWNPSMPACFPSVASEFPGHSRIADRDGQEVAVADASIGVCVGRVSLDPARKKLTLPSDLEKNRPWISPPLPDYRLFFLYEWFGKHYYQHQQKRHFKSENQHANL